MPKTPTPQSAPASRGNVALWVLAVVVIALIPYIGSLRGEFTLDDWPLIVRDPLVHSLANLPKAFQTDFLHGNLGAESAYYYRPLITASFQLDYAIAGPNPLYFRVVNVLLNLAIVLLVFALGKHLTKSLFAAGVGAAAFATLPSHAESVAWVSGRTDLISTLFIVACLLVFVRSYDSPGGFKWPAAALCAALFGCALFSKEIGAATPLLALVYVWAFGKPKPKSDWLKWGLAFGSMLLVYMVVRHHAIGADVEQDAYLALGPRVMGIGIAYAAYLRMLFAPQELRVIYDVFPIGVKYPVVALAAWLLPVGLVVLALWVRKRYRLAAFCSFWIVLALLPVTNILPTIGPLPAERFVYLASVGSSLLIGWGAMKILEWRPRLLQNWQMVACAGIGAFIVYCGALATQSSAYYMSDVAWARGIAASGSRFSTLRVCAGRSLAKAGLVEEGAREMEAAFALSHKGDLEAGDYIMLAVLERARGKRTEALDLLTRARMEFGDSAELEYHTGVLMADAGNVVGARDAFLRATELKPQLGPAWRNLGRANLKLKRFAESVKAYERAFAIVRPSTRDHLELGQAYAGAAMPDKAVRELQTVVSDDANGDLGSQAAGILRGIK